MRRRAAILLLLLTPRGWRALAQDLAIATRAAKSPSNASLTSSTPIISSAPSRS